MVRLTLVLAIAIYLVLLLVPGIDHAPRTDTPEEGGSFLASILNQAESNAATPPQAPRGLIVRETRDRLVEDANGVRLETVRGDWLEIAAIIDPSSLLDRTSGSPADIAQVTLAPAPAPDITSDATPEAQPVESAAAAEAQSAPDAGAIWRVTGDRVNFRSGPSTETAILTALVFGDEVEYIADAPEDWARLRVLATGQEGYMAMRFLEPAN